ncbi:MAG: hypothetical protein WBD20_27350 [Pirellulaceae bacterium]
MAFRLIATDEAGYGPKLGPLVIGATDWQTEFSGPAITTETLTKQFAPLAQVYRVGDAKVLVNDSKAVYKPRSNQSSSAGKLLDPLGNLHATVSVANRCCSDSCNVSIKRFDQWLKVVAGSDWKSIKATPWLADVQSSKFLVDSLIDEAVGHWKTAGAALQCFRGRVIPASQFNAACDGGMNKADLLSESTLGLVRDLLDGKPHNSVATASKHPTWVFCDRHGGRRYYAGVLQHVFPGSEVQVVSESKQQSVYRMQYSGQTALVHFTVKGDSFIPVALSSIYAKYIRERMMESVNQFFLAHHTGKQPLQPTAGYPVDADRFLSEIESTMRKQSIAMDDLVRRR